MVASLANTIFQGNSRDAMIVSDAYKISNNGTHNTMYDSVKGIYSGAVGGLYANKSSVTTLANLVKNASAGTVDKTTMLTTALGAMGSSLPSLLGSLGSTLKNTLASSAGSLIGDNASKSVEVLYGSAGLLLGVANVGDTSSLLKFVNAMAGDSALTKFINIEAESAIIGGIAKSLMDFGIPELVDEVIQMSSSKSAQDNAYAYLSTSAIGGSNLKMINNVIDKIGLTVFLQNNPDAVASIIASYTFDTSYTVADYPTQRALLLNTLVRIDANWNQKLRNAVYVPNLGPFLKQSSSSKKLFCMALPERSLSLDAVGKSSLTVTAVVKTLYPNAYIPGIK